MILGLLIYTLGMIATYRMVRTDHMDEYGEFNIEARNAAAFYSFLSWIGFVVVFYTFIKRKFF